MKLDSKDSKTLTFKKWGAAKPGAKHKKAKA